MPRSSTARFTEMWQKSTEDADFLEHVVERWRNSASGGENQNQIAAFADALGIGDGDAAHAPHAPHAPAHGHAGGLMPAEARGAPRVGEGRQSGGFTGARPSLGGGPGAPMGPQPPASGLRRRESALARKDVPSPAPASSAEPAGAGAAGSTGFRALRERLAAR